jgi:hypothetical protein
MKPKTKPAEMCSLRWTKKKPRLDQECLLLAATLFSGRWDYTLFQVVRIDCGDNWYWGICTEDGEEWGAYSDLKADRYCKMKTLNARAGRNGRVV